MPVIIMLILLLVGCGCTKNETDLQPERHDQGLAESVAMSTLGIKTAHAAANVELVGDTIIMRNPDEGAVPVWMGTYEDTFPSHPLSSATLDFFAFCFHNDTVDNTNDGIYWSNGSSWTGPLSSTVGTVTGAGSWSDEQLLMGDGTTAIQGITGWTAPLSVLTYSSGTADLTLGSGGFYYERSSPSTTALSFAVTGDAVTRYQVGTNGDVYLGSGSSGHDVNYYRSAANVLALAAGDSFRIIGSGSDPGSPSAGQIYYRTDTTELKVWDGSAWDVLNAGASPLTTKGDLFTYDTGDQRLAVGTNNYALTPDSAQSTGLKWAVPMTLQGDLGTPQNLLIGDAIDIAGGTAISTTGGSPDTVTVNYNGAISDNSDVDTTGVSTDDSLVYSGSAWNDQKTYYTTSFTSSGWTLFGGSLYYQTFTHNLGKQYVNIQVYDSSDLRRDVISSPAATGDIARVVATSTTTCTLWIYNGNSIPGTWNLVCTR